VSSISWILLTIFLNAVAVAAAAAAAAADDDDDVHLYNAGIRLTESR
jgi:hypothetical protein